jgi:hypothetical protein
MPEPLNGVCGASPSVRVPDEDVLVELPALNVAREIRKRLDLDPQEMRGM